MAAASSASSPAVHTPNGNGKGLHIGFATLSAVLSVIGLVVMLGGGLFSQGGAHGKDEQRLAAAETRVGAVEADVKAVAADCTKTRERTSVAESRIEAIEKAFDKIDQKLERLLRAAPK